MSASSDTGPCRFPFDQRNLHMLDFDAHQEEVDFANDDVFEVVLWSVVFEFDVKAIFNTDFHLDGVVNLGVVLMLGQMHLIVIHPDVHLFNYVWGKGSSGEGEPQEVAAQLEQHYIPKTNITSVVWLVLFLYVAEFEVNS